MLKNIVQLLFVNHRSIYNVKFLKTYNMELTRCNYSRWASRNPTAIVNEDELFESDDSQTIINKPQRFSRKRRSKPKKTKEQKEEQNEIKEIKNKKSIYTALQENDRLISSIMIDVKSRKRRTKNHKILLEGARLIQDALEAGAKPNVIFFNRLSDILSLSLPEETKLYKIPYRTIQLWSNLTTSPGLLGIFETPNVEERKAPDDAIPLTIICDNIREPGNLGTIIRAAAAVGCKKLLLMKGCVDLWDPKVIRGAVGAHFRVPIFTFLTWDAIPNFISNESQILLADNNVTYDIESKDSTIILKSDADTSTETDHNIEIEALEENIENKGAKISELASKFKKPTAKTKLIVKKLISQLPVVPYHKVDYTQKEMILVIAGETEGVSLESCELLRTRNCIRINIPLTNGIDSLNTSMAAGIVAFEIKRQFIARKIDNE